MIIALANNKGGTGKTTTAVNLGAALAEKEKRVLLIDIDPQGNLSVNLGVDIDKPRGAMRSEAFRERTIYDVLLNPESMILKSVILHDLSGMDLAPANIDLSGAMVELYSVTKRDTSSSVPANSSFTLRITQSSSQDNVTNGFSFPHLAHGGLLLCIPVGLFLPLFLFFLPLQRTLSPHLSRPISCRVARRRLDELTS